MPVSVVVPCFDERATIELMLDRVLASPWTAEVVIVDDGSTDGTRDLLEKIDDPRVRRAVPRAQRGQGRRAAHRLRRRDEPST